MNFPGVLLQGWNTSSRYQKNIYLTHTHVLLLLLQSSAHLLTPLLFTSYNCWVQTSICCLILFFSKLKMIIKSFCWFCLCLFYQLDNQDYLQCNGDTKTDKCCYFPKEEDLSDSLSSQLFGCRFSKKWTTVLSGILLGHPAIQFQGLLLTWTLNGTKE